MRCHQTELRLQELLDNRQPVKGDPQLAELMAECPESAALVAAYEQMADCFRAEQEQQGQTVSGLADRVLEEMNAPARDASVATRKTITKHWKRWASLAIAASVAFALVVINELPGGNPAGDPPISSSDEVTEPADLLPPPTIAHTTEPPTLPGGDMWYQTGQRLASISLLDLGRQYYTSTQAESASDESPSPWIFTPPLNEFWPSESDSAPESEGTGHLTRSISYAMV